MSIEYKIENIGGNINVCVSKAHTFGTDSFLLSDFATPRRKDITCDLGSGCGIIPLLWYRDPETAPQKSIAVDIQDEAIWLARQSAEISNLGDKLEIIQKDLCKIKSVAGVESFDLVTCNPPYKAAGTGIISDSESDKIARHETLCTIDDVSACAAKLLKFGGKLCMCQLPERLTDVIVSMRNHKIEPKRIRFVQKDIYSAPWLFLIEGKLGAKPFLNIESPLLLKENGETSQEMLRIYKYYGKV